MSELVPALSGCRILLTAQRRADELAAALRRRGAAVDCVATLGMVPHVDEARLLARTRELVERPADVLVVTTGIGFRSWLDTADAAGLADDLVTALERVRLVARGPKALGALQAAGLTADWVAESETSAEIVDLLLGEGVAGQRIAVQHHGAGDDALDLALSGAGAEVVPLEVYRWGPPPDPEALARSALAVGDGDYDAVLFTSAPGASAWLAALDDARVTDRVRDRVSRGRLILAAVGPVTAEPLAYAGMLAHQPTRSRMGALARLVITELGDDRHAVSTAQGRLRVRASAATLDHRPVGLSPGGLAVLRRLALTPGSVVTREELLQVLPGSSRDPHTAEVAVARLREALRRAGGDGRMVRTVVKRGYVLAPG